MRAYASTSRVFSLEQKINKRRERWLGFDKSAHFSFTRERKEEPQSELCFRSLIPDSFYVAHQKWPTPFPRTLLFLDKLLLIYLFCVFQSTVNHERFNSGLPTPRVPATSRWRCMVNRCSGNFHFSLFFLCCYRFRPQFGDTCIASFRYW